MPNQNDDDTPRLAKVIAALSILPSPYLSSTKVTRPPARAPMPVSPQCTFHASRRSVPMARLSIIFQSNRYSITSRQGTWSTTQSRPLVAKALSTLAPMYVTLAPIGKPVDLVEGRSESRLIDRLREPSDAYDVACVHELGIGNGFGVNDPYDRPA